MSTTTATRAASTVAAGIERRLALQILRGERAPGTRLPPVRSLAREHGVTAPTIQRVVERLEAGGLVTARRGSGVTVNDPRRVSDLSLLPLKLEALAGQPETAARVLADFLELRRVLAAHLLRTSAARIAAAAPQLVALVLGSERAETLAEIADADLAFTAAVVEATGQSAVAAIMHTTARLVREVPQLAEALYGDRAYHRRVLRGAAAAFAQPSPATAARELEDVLSAWDRRTVSRFRAALSPR
jgi:DNA-binding FadR family transcriptional regulator